MSLRKLGDIATYINGYAFKPSDWEDEGLPIIRIQNLTGNAYSENKYNGVIDDKYIVNTGDVLISWSASLGVYRWEKGKAVLNQHIFKVMFDKEQVDKDYYIYQVSRILSRSGTDAHGSTMHHLTRPIFNKLPYIQLDIGRQRDISVKLNKVQTVINVKQRQLIQLDSLIKSRFVEMFGDPVLNERKWRTNTLKNKTTKIGSGATPRGGKGSYKNKGISLIRSMNVYDGRFEYKDLAHLNNEQAKQLDNVEVLVNDVLFNITGASIARTCIVPIDVLPARVNQHVSIIRCNNELDPIFVNMQFLHKSFKNILLGIGERGGATRQAITKQQLENLMIIVPPLGLQTQFAEFVQQVDKLKAVVQKSLDETQMLFDALMQEYFG